MEMMTAYETDGVLRVPFLGTCSLQLLAVKHTTRTLSGPPSTGLLRSSTQSRPHMHHDTKHEAPLQRKRPKRRVVEGNRDRCDLGTLSGQLQVFVVWYK